MKPSSPISRPTPVPTFLAFSALAVVLFLVAVWTEDTRWAQTGFVMLFPTLGAGLWWASKHMS